MLVHVFRAIHRNEGWMKRKWKMNLLPPPKSGLQFLYSHHTRKQNALYPQRFSPFPRIIRLWWEKIHFDLYFLTPPSLLVTSWSREPNELSFLRPALIRISSRTWEFPPFLHQARSTLISMSSQGSCSSLLAIRGTHLWCSIAPLPPQGKLGDA